MKKDEYILNLFIGISIVIWGIIGLYDGVIGQFSIVRFCSSFLNLCIGLFFIFRSPIIKSGSNFSILISIPSFLCGGLLFKMAHPFDTWPLLLEITFVIGVLFALISFLYLGKNFAIFPSLRSISLKGPYRCVRHPCYISELVMTFSCCMAHVSFCTITVFILFILFLYFRIEEEEKLLSNSAIYVNYKSNVKWKLIPYIW
jgi:protein-S-isoprenylcysteine O-methyltransferase Ste14